MHKATICAKLPILPGNPIPLFDYISIKDLIIISTISPGIKDMIGNYLRMKWHEALGKFVDSPTGFCDVLRQTHSVVSGSLALHYIMDGPTSWSASDCDIYCPKGAKSTSTLR